MTTHKSLMAKLKTLIKNLPELIYILFRGQSHVNQIDSNHALINYQIPYIAIWSRLSLHSIYYRMLCAWDSDKIYPTWLHSSPIVVTPFNSSYDGIRLNSIISYRTLNQFLVNIFFRDPFLFG